MLNLSIGRGERVTEVMIVADDWASDCRRMQTPFGGEH